MAVSGLLPPPPSLAAPSRQNACNVEFRRCRTPSCDGVIVFFIGEGIGPLDPGQRATALCRECGSGHALWRVAQGPAAPEQPAVIGDGDEHERGGHGRRRRRVGHTLT